ncbi:EAL domain-containing protein [Salinisphaera sp. SPP-AMP-43]|uniref:putative bifunctional diguanylate cyclase/phosphodiesterase n=1 Tax=Salinisphaera sp. SPP-AMP-43 TaxID=3121288 RepID=UPI003C6E1B08
MSDTSVSAVSKVVRSAAQVLDCQSAVFYRFDSNTFYPVYSQGRASATAHPIADAGWIAARPGIDAIRIFRNPGAEPSGVPPFVVRDMQHARFVVLAPVMAADNRVTGLLLLADAALPAGPSAAALYALCTHTLQLSRECERPASVEEPIAEDGWDISNRLRLFESVVEHATDAVLITEARPIELPGPRIIYCNASFTNTTGYTEAEVLGQTPRLLQNAQTCRATLDRVREALAHWQPIEVELLNQRKNGQHFWMELSVVPVANEQGRYTHWVSVQRDITERRRADAVAAQMRLTEAQNAVLEAKLQERHRVERSLAYAASHDDLTHLHNRSYVMERLEDLLAQDVIGTSLLFLDMDRFKRINDTLGHRAGDVLLTQMARRLETCVRHGDTLARVGGDEFLVLIENDRDGQVAAGVAERIITAFELPFRVSEQDIVSSASVGIVQLDNSYDSPEQMIRDADLAMYAAKQDGPGHYRRFCHAMRSQASERLALQTDLQQALDHEQLALLYQPIYALGPQGDWLGVEALVRWQHPERGLLEPGAFVGLAEEAGLAREMGDWIMRRACRELIDWGRAADHWRLFVNVSMRELRDHRFLEQIDAALAASGLAPERLCLEITEAVFDDDPEPVAVVLEQLRIRGIRVALDDFGAGYSSLGYLNRYPIDAIKIDRAFVIAITHTERTRAIVDSILSLGQALRVDVIAEGIETEEELALLKRLGCPYGQGYWLTPPLSANQIVDTLDTVSD